MINGELAGRVSIQMIAAVLYLCLQIEAAATTGALEVQMLKEVGLSGIFELLMAAAGTDRNADSGQRGTLNGLGHDTDAIRNHCLLIGSIMLQHFRNLTQSYVAIIDKHGLAKLITLGSVLH